MLSILRFIRHTSIWLFMCLPLMLLGIPLVALALCLVKKDDYYLPFFFRWWDNADLYIGRDTSAYIAVCNEGKWPRYQWLVFRNPINYFDYVLLGLWWSDDEVYTHYNPNDDDVGNSTGDRPGFRYIEVKQDGRIYYEYYWIYKYSFWPTKCFRFRFGWKIGSNKNPPKTISQWCLVIAPCFPYRGKSG